MKLTLQNLSFAYPQQVPLLKNITAELAPGQVHYLAGPNGSGKSTLLKLLCSWLQPTAGNILLDDRLLSNFSSIQRAQRINMVWQNLHYPWACSVQELVMMLAAARFPRWGKLQSGERSRIAEALQLFGLSDSADQSIQQLSGGELQRAMLAGAWALQPDVMLLDEPTSALDPAWRNQAVKNLEDYAREHIVLVVTHDMELVGRAGNSLWMLDGQGNFYCGNDEKMFAPELWSRIYATAANIETAANGRRRITFD